MLRNTYDLTIVRNNIVKCFVAPLWTILSRIVWMVSVNRVVPYSLCATKLMLSNVRIPLVCSVDNTLTVP